MFDFVRAWLAQRGHTSPFPRRVGDFPERFRGRPRLDCGEALDGAPERAEYEERSTGLVARRERRLPVIDLGACLFSPEEVSTSECCRLSYTRDIRMASSSREGLVSATGEPAAVRALDERMQKRLGRSLRLRSVSAGSCNGCEAELAALGNVVFDMARFGVQFVASPRHADGLVITGAVSVNMRDALERTYEATPDPRIVIAVGACAASGGPFRGSPEVVGIPPSIPVDLWIAGCPPHPLTVLDALLRLVGRIRPETSDTPAEATAPNGRERARADTVRN